MYYTGKRADTFEPALCQLLEYNGSVRISSPDCAGLRAFGFRADGGQRNWFRPFIQIENSVQILGKVTGLPLTAVHLNRDRGESELPDSFVLGPVCRGIAAPGAAEYYYSGDGRYLFVRQFEEQYEVYDPYGFPGLRMTWDELSGMADSRNTCCIYLESDRSGHRRTVKDPGAEVILKNGLKYHRKIAEKEKESLNEAVRQYVDTQSGRIALRCGVINMIQMLDKVFTLAGKCGKMTAQAEYTDRKQTLFHMAQAGDIRGLSDELSYIWRSLENDER